MIAFHRFLIGTAIVFCGGFTLWAYAVYQRGGGTTFQVLSACFGTATVGLCYYLMNLRRFLRR